VRHGPDAELRLRLAQLEARDLYRRRRIQDAPQQPHALVEGRAMLSFCGNDYLGLANHPEVVAALHQGAERWGVGSGSAHLVSGHSRAHHALEEALAELTGRPRALLFSTGYMANLGVITALADRGDTVFEDRLNHASLLDGALLSRASLKRYPHGDCGLLERLIGGGPARLIVTDGVFSMDGDLAPLPALAETAQRSGAWLMVDDAHGMGVIGRGGRGSLDHFGLGPQEVPILMGTLGKAYGGFGAFVAGSEELIELLIQSARSYIYTTATPPALAVAALKALEIAERDDWRRERLMALIKRFRRGAAELGLALADSQTPIQPLLAGSAARALLWSQALEAAGILARAIRPPTVPEGTARLRITFSAAHSQADVDRLLDALATLPTSPPST
jgi:8-amino-7-oxononanoate synthase